MFFGPIELKKEQGFTRKDRPVFFSHLNKQKLSQNDPDISSPAIITEEKSGTSSEPLFEGYVSSLSESVDSKMENQFETRLSGAEIFLVVYNLSSMNLCLSKLGIAVYHSTVRIFSVEFGYGSHHSNSTGVFEMDSDSDDNPLSFENNEPQSSGHKNLKKSQVIPMGHCTKTYKEIEEIIEELKIEYIGCQYDLIKHNCNHFTDELCFKLLGKHIPNYVNRIANMAKFIRCLIPKKILKNTISPSQENTANERVQENNSMEINMKRLGRGDDHDRRKLAYKSLVIETQELDADHGQNVMSTRLESPEEKTRRAFQEAETPPGIKNDRKASVKDQDKVH